MTALVTPATWGVGVSDGSGGPGTGATLGRRLREGGDAWGNVCPCTCSILTSLPDRYRPRATAAAVSQGSGGPLPVPSLPAWPRTLSPPQQGRWCRGPRRPQVIDREARVEQAQPDALCQVRRLLMTLLLTLYRVGQCLTHRGICLLGIYLPLWHKSNPVL